MGKIMFDGVPYAGAPGSGGGGGSTSADAVSYDNTTSLLVSTNVQDAIDEVVGAVPTVTDTYSGTSSDGMSGKAVKSAIDALDGTITGSAGASKTLTALSQTDGKISATFSDISITKSQVSDFPTIPTVNNATLTIQLNGTTVNTFTANASSNVTANIQVPTFKELTGTLAAGATSLTISDSSITTDSTIDYYTSVYTVQPTNATASTGSVVLTFEAQSSAVSVKIRVWS